MCRSHTSHHDAFEPVVRVTCSPQQVANDAMGLRAVGKRDTQELQRRPNLQRKGAAS